MRVGRERGETTHANVIGKDKRLRLQHLEYVCPCTVVVDGCNVAVVLVSLYPCVVYSEIERDTCTEQECMPQ
jgi:hypothetical protein